jgi:O-antigen/teichoic acid export membrane protein
MIHLNLAHRKLTLTQRALLTVIGNMVVQGAEFLTGFFITPYIIRGLGQELYGAWGMIQQAINYFSMTDFRSSATLRFLLGLYQHEENPTTKQQLIGASLLLWAFCMPLTIALGIGLVYFAPLLIHTSAVNEVPVRIAFAVLLFNSVVDRILSIPMNILRAQNLDYIGMGINAMTVLGGSLLSAAAIWLGFGCCNHDKHNVDQYWQVHYCEKIIALDGIDLTRQTRIPPFS